MGLSLNEIVYFRQGSWSNWSIAGLHGTLHLPYVRGTFNRNCPFSEVGADESCPVPSGEIMVLDPPGRLLQADNTHFLENLACPEDLTALGNEELV